MDVLGTLTPREEKVLKLRFGIEDVYKRQVLVCRKLYWQDMDPAHFLDPGIDGKWYPDQDYHRIYIGEIVECLKKV